MKNLVILAIALGISPTVNGGDVKQGYRGMQTMQKDQDLGRADSSIIDWPRIEEFEQLEPPQNISLREMEKMDLTLQFRVNVGLIIYDSESDNWITYGLVKDFEDKGSIKSILRGEGALFIFTEKALIHYDYERDSTSVVDCKPEFVRESKGTIWIAYSHYDSFRLSKYTIANRVLQEVTISKDEVIRGAIQDMEVDKTHIWIAVYYKEHVLDAYFEVTGGVNSYNILSDTWQRFDFGQYRTKKVSSIVLADEKIWFGTARGLVSYRPYQKKWRLFTIERKGVASLSIFSDLVLCVTSDLTLYSFHTRNLKWTKVKDNVSNEFIYTDKYIYYLQTCSPGTHIHCFVLQYDMESHKVTYYPARRGILGTPHTMAFDGNYIWFAGAAISRYDADANKWEVFTNRDGIPDNRASEIAVGEHGVWFNQKDNIVRYDKKDNRFASHCKDDYQFTADLNLPNLDLWQKLIIVKKLSTEGEKSHTHVTRRIIHEGDKTWIGVGNSLACYDRQTSKVREYKIGIGISRRRSPFGKIAVHKDYVFGTRIGWRNYSLVAFDRRTLKMTSLANILPGGSTWDIFCDGDQLYVSIGRDSKFGGALLEYDIPHNKWQFYTSEEIDTLRGKGWAPIYLASDRRFLFTSTKGGILCIEKNTGRWHFYKTPGLRRLFPGNAYIWILWGRKILRIKKT